MKYYIGIDLGTSSVKLLLLSAEGRVVKTVSESYSVFYPQTGWSEQNPNDWAEQTVCGLKKLLCGIDSRSVRGISVAGQMHGLVILNDKGEVLRPAILWNDSRSTEETDWLNRVIGKARLSSLTGNIAFPGFTLPKLLWVRNHEPEIYEQIATVLLPKDYLVYRLTGILGSEPSDACGTLYYDVKNACWSKEMLKLCGVPFDWMPPLRRSDEIVGTVTAEYSTLFNGARPFVTAGAGDNAAAALGTGILEEGTCNLSLGTSGTVLVPCGKYSTDPANALHTFVHADGNCMLLGCVLSAASCGQWWIEDILGTRDYANEQASFSAMGDGNVYFLPYLMGERSPHNDPNARGLFMGMSRNTTRVEMTQAVYEGVTFALRDCLEIAKKQDVNLSRVCLCGGGAVSPQWQQMTADILNLTVEIPTQLQGPSLGAALLAAKADGCYSDLKAAAKHMVSVKQRFAPNSLAAEQYEKKYQQFRSIYQALKPYF